MRQRSPFSVERPSSVLVLFATSLSTDSGLTPGSPANRTSPSSGVLHFACSSGPMPETPTYMSSSTTSPGEPHVGRAELGDGGVDCALARSLLATASLSHPV